MPPSLLPRQLGVVFASVVLLSFVWAYLRPLAQVRQELDPFSYAGYAEYDTDDWEDEAGDYYEWADGYGLPNEV